MDTSANDKALSSLISVVDQARQTGAELGIPVTLCVSGVVITGQLISGAVYYDKFAQELTDLFKRSFGSSELDRAGDGYKKWGEKYDPSHPEYQKEPEYIFLSEGELMPGSDSLISGQSGLFKIRLSDVSGFSLGYTR